MTALSRTLLFLGRQERLKDAALGLAPLRRLASRFVAGEDVREALGAVEALNRQGLTASLDHLNEAVTAQPETHAEVREYARLLQLLDLRGGRANASIKLTQLGLGIDRDVALKNARAVVAEAASRDNFVRVDMEGSAFTEATLALFGQLHREFGKAHVGVAVQAYLRRTGEDVRRLLAKGARLRLCKGAYLEPPSVAFGDKRAVDANFIALMRRLLDSGGDHAIATHDERIIEEALAHHARGGAPKHSFELEMLYGVRRDLQRRLVSEGYRVRVYVPYGRSWYPYLMRRLAERPANLWFFTRSLVQG